MTFAEKNSDGHVVCWPVLSADGRKVLTGSPDNAARVWNADGIGQPIKLNGHSAPVAHLAFSADGKKVFAGAGNTGWVWNANGTGQPIELKGHWAPVFSIALRPDGRKVVTGSSDRTARVWTLDVLDIRAHLWQQTSYCLQPERRSALLGESESVAKAAYTRCRDTVERCRAGFDTCHQVVAKMYNEP